MLKDKIVEVLKETEAQVSISIKNLSQNHWVLRLDDTRKIPAASIIKVLIMIEAFCQVDEGKFHLNQKIVIPREEQIPYSIITDLEENTYQLVDLIQLMITVSDNTATNVLINILGFNNINGRAKNLGLKETQLNRKMLDFEAVKEGKQNFISGEDAVKMLELIINDKAASPAMCQRMMSILFNQKDAEMIRRFIPNNIKVAHKTGELHNLNHDVGIVILPNIVYIIGVFVDDAIDNLEAKTIIGKISSITYNYFLN